MSDVESRALRRAVALLLILSAARWISSRPEVGRGPVAQRTAAEAGTQAHAESVRAAADEGARRARPLEDGERIDPNRASEEELDRLPGVGPATARAIVEARAAGVVFRRAEDLAVVRGIGPAAVERIRTSLELGTPPAGRPGASGAGSIAPGRADPSRRPAAATGRQSAAPPSPQAVPGPVDLNRAGEGELVRLPGIGPVLAARIVAERRRGAFASVDDLARVPGVGPATVERLRTLAVVR